MDDDIIKSAIESFGIDRINRANEHYSALGLTASAWAIFELTIDALAIELAGIKASASEH